MSHHSIGNHMFRNWEIECEANKLKCQSCGEQVSREDLHVIGNELICTDCSVRCGNCGEQSFPNQMNYSVRWYMPLEKEANTMFGTCKDGVCEECLRTSFESEYDVTYCNVSDKPKGV